MIGLSLAMTAVRVRSAQRAHLDREPLPDPPDGRLARFDQQLGAVAADVEPQEVEPSSARWTICVLSSLKDRPLGASHSASRALICSACSPGVAEHDQIVGVSDHDRGAWLGLPGTGAGGRVADPGGLLQPVQRDVQEQR